jgi:hypothetical protein
VSQPAGLQTDLTAVTASGAGSAWAAGSSDPVSRAAAGQAAATAAYAPVVLRFTGRSWRAVPVPAPVAGEVETAVADGGPGDAWMVGSAGLRRWDGSAWRRFPLRGFADQPGSPVTDQAAAAGGGAWLTTSRLSDRLGDGILAWNGRTWRLTPERGDALSAVTASGPDDAWVVGSRESAPGPVVLFWDGPTWADMSPASAFPNLTLTHVAAAGPRDLWATGVDQRPARGADNLVNVAVAVHYNGRTWTETPLPAQPSLPGGSDAGQLFAIALDSAGHPWVSASSDSADRSMYFHWDGRAWARVYGPRRTGAIEVGASGIAALRGGHALLSVGAADIYLGPQSAVSEILGARGSPAGLAPTGATPAAHVPGVPGWSAVAVPPLPPQASLDAVTALDRRHIWAAGEAYAGLVAPGVPLVLRFDGARWLPVTSRGLGWRGTLTSIAATGPSDVWAAGTDTAGMEHIVHLAGPAPSWAEVPFPGQGTAGLSIQVVAAPGAEPWVIGSHANGAGFLLPLLLRWTGQRWVAVPMPALPHGAVPSIPTAVQVISPNDVWLASQALFGPSVLSHWNGRAWDQQLDPGFGIAGMLAAGPRDMWAIGAYGPAPHMGTCCVGPQPRPRPYPGIGRWNGTTWKFFPVPGGLTPTSITPGADGQPAWVSTCPNTAPSCRSGNPLYIERYLPYIPGYPPLRPGYLRYDGVSFPVTVGPPLDSAVAMASVPGTGQTVAVGQVGYLDKLAGDLSNPYRQTFAPVIEFSNADPARPSSR